jgi:hypothetical protein
MRRLHLSTILLIASILWGLLLIIGGVAVDVFWLRYLSIVSGGLLALIAAFDRWLWRLPVLRGWFVKRPDISGTWQAKVISNWVDPKTGNNIQPISCYMIIWQTYSSISLRLITSESASELIGSEIVLHQDGMFRVVAIYKNEPKQMSRDHSSIHYGAMLLQCTGPIPNLVKGNYWTDRKTYGEIELYNRRRQIYPDYEAATQAYEGNLCTS